MNQQPLFDVPNLDDLSIDPADLHKAAEMFGRLAAYADMKARAMELRTQGDVEAALCFERNCETTYKRLPAWARW